MCPFAYVNSLCFHLNGHQFIFLTCHRLYVSWYGSEFQDIFDVDHFITSLRDEVRILKELPPRVKRRVELGMIYTMPPVSWSDMSYYQNQVSSFHIWLGRKSLFHFLNIVKPLNCVNYIGERSFSLTNICYFYVLCRFFLSYRNTKLYI